MSGDPAQEYFVDGMTDLLTNRLSSISSLHVISRTSAMSFKGVNKPLAQIAAALKVDAIVEGSVTRDGERVRVTVQIIHAGTDVRLWGNSYERETTDAFRLQAEMARTIANELRAVFSERSQRSVDQTLEAKPQAQEWFLRGRYLMDTRNRDHLKEARTLLERAVELDPNFALAWATLARCYTMLENTGVLAVRRGSVRSRPAPPTRRSAAIPMRSRHTWRSPTSSSSSTGSGVRPMHTIARRSTPMAAPALPADNTRNS